MSAHLEPNSGCCDGFPGTAQRRFHSCLKAPSGDEPAVSIFLYVWLAMQGILRRFMSGRRRESRSGLCNPVTRQLHSKIALTRPKSQSPTLLHPDSSLPPESRIADAKVGRS